MSVIVWWSPTPTSKAHGFVAGDETSLCGKIARELPTSTANEDPNKGRCKSCVAAMPPEPRDPDKPVRRSIRRVYLAVGGPQDVSLTENEQILNAELADGGGTWVFILCPGGSVTYPMPTGTSGVRRGHCSNLAHAELGAHPHQWNCAAWQLRR